MRSHVVRLSLALAACVCLSVVAFAQNDLLKLFGPGEKVGGGTKQAEISVTLSPASAKAGDTVTLKVEIDVPADAYTYSMDPDFSGRTRVNTPTVNGLEAIDTDFTANQKPVVKDDKNFGQKVETLKGKVSWSRKYRVVDPAVAELSGEVRLQVCDASSCRPLNKKFAVNLGGAGAAPKFTSTHPLTVKSSGKDVTIVEWTAKLSPETAKAGDVVTVSFSAKLAEGYHIFALDQNPKNLGKPTTFTIENVNGMVAASAKAGFQPNRKSEDHHAEGVPQKVYHHEVTFSQQFKVQDTGEKSEYGVTGLVLYQICNEGNCRQSKFEFALGTPQNKKPSAQRASIGPIDGGDALAQFLDGLKYRDASGADASQTGLLMYLLYAFVGGVILNVMPCVLPVIAIKALSFVQQAGENRSRILLLNGAYSAGVISVFLLLATLAAFAGMSWGGLFQKVGFNIAMCVLVFAMGLSLLGVFEIPLPGFVGAAAGSQHREGPSGAFLTGIFATILATPCSGPFLGTTLGWSVKQPPHIVYLVWGMMGLGMSSPYLLFALYPRAIKLLPRPGNWMVTFKQLAGFVLLGTAIYLLSLVEGSYQMPVLITLLGVAFGGWMVGNLYDYSSTNQRRWVVRTAAAVSVLGMSWFGFGLRHGDDKLEWKIFHPQSISEALAKGQPVMVDFTADWCLTCKVVERTTLNTDATAAVVSKYDIVPFRADWTDGSDEIREVLDRLGSTSIPVLAVFSPDNPKEPIILRDAWTQAALLQELESVGSRVKKAPVAQANGVKLPLQVAQSRDTAK